LDHPFTAPSLELGVIHLRSFMRIADHVLADFMKNGLLTFPEDASCSVTGSCIAGPTGLHGRQILRFADDSELLLVHEGGPVQVTLSKAYQLRVAAERSASPTLQPVKSLAQQFESNYDRTGHLEMPNTLPAVATGQTVAGKPCLSLVFQDGSHVNIVTNGGCVEVVAGTEADIFARTGAYADRSNPTYQGEELHAEHAMVSLREDLEFGGKVIKAGTVGAIVSVHPDHAAYTVEFDVDGETVLPDLIHTDLAPATAMPAALAGTVNAQSSGN
jgi:hypothetical protein